MPDESVGLVYLDPPFNSNASYNVLFKERSGEESPAQIKAFTDTWEWTQGVGARLRARDNRQPHRARCCEGDDLGLPPVRRRERHDGLLGDDGAAPRRVAPRSSSPPAQSISTATPTASHYLKLLMDTVFGPEQFRTEITWKRTSAHSDTRQGRQQHGHVHDLISNGGSWTWNPIYVP